MRAYAAAGTTPQQRRDALEQYLGHVPVTRGGRPRRRCRGARLPRCAPTGRSPTPRGRGGSAYGWTSVPSRRCRTTSPPRCTPHGTCRGGAPADRFGFAWAPSNTLGLTGADFAAQTGAILDRLGAAIRDSGVPSVDPGPARARRLVHRRARRRGAHDGVAGLRHLVAGRSRGHLPARDARPPASRGRPTDRAAADRWRARYGPRRPARRARTRPHREAASRRARPARGRRP